MVEMAEAMHAESRYRQFQISPSKIEQFFRNIIDEKYFVVLVDGEPVHAMFVGCVQPFWWGDDLESFDLLLFVMPEKRGKGFSAARLVNGYLQIAGQMGVSDVKLGTSTGVDPERTERFFERLGFQPMSRGFAFNHAQRMH